MNEVFDLQKLRMKTLNIAVPEIIYEELYRRGMIRRVNEIVINHFIDILDEKCQELNGMDRSKKQY